jgi:hypothetical protein
MRAAQRNNCKHNLKSPDMDELTLPPNARESIFYMAITRPAKAASLLIQTQNIGTESEVLANAIDVLAGHCWAFELGPMIAFASSGCRYNFRRSNQLDDIGNFQKPGW